MELIWSAQHTGTVMVKGAICSKHFIDVTIETGVPVSQMHNNIWP